MVSQSTFIRSKECKLLENENKHFDIAISETIFLFTSFLSSSVVVSLFCWFVIESKRMNLKIELIKTLVWFSNRKAHKKLCYYALCLLVYLFFMLCTHGNVSGHLISTTPTHHVWHTEKTFDLKIFQKSKRATWSYLLHALKCHTSVRAYVYCIAIIVLLIFK